MDAERRESARILIVDDEPVNVRLLERILRQAGYREVAGITDSRRVLPAVREAQPDLILLDLHMPHRTGNDILADLRAELPRELYLPVLVLSADTMQGARNSVLTSGAHDFLAKPFDREEVLLRVRNLLETRFLHLELRRHNERLEDEVQRRTRELRSALHAAEAAGRAKSQFMGNMGHELRTPLTKLRGPLLLVERLEGERMSPQGRQMLDVALRASERLERGLLDILLLSALQAGDEVPELGAVPLEPLLRELAGELGPIAAREVSLSVVAPPELAPLRTDAVRLKDALRRILENALRFTEAGTVTVEAVAAPGTGELLEIRIRDTGPGIPADRIAAIFDPFEQADNSDTRKHQGFGLGLAIARGLCTLLGYTLRARSVQGAGSEFGVAPGRDRPGSG